jgi:type II secretory pathway pseudopilin PulG
MIKRAGSGFTLIELVVTTAFLGIVVVAISSLFIGLRQINKTADSFTTASQVAQQIMEKYRNTPYSSITVGTTDVTATELAGYPTLLTPRSATVTVTEVDVTGLKQLEVAITYKDRTGIKHVELSTLISYKGINK